MGHWLRTAGRRDLVRADRDAYRRRPVTVSEFGDLLAAQSLDDHAEDDQ